MALPVNCVNPSSISPSERSEHEGEAVYCARLTKRGSEHKGEVKTTTCGLVGVEKHPTNNYTVTGDIQSKSNSKLRNRISKPSTLHGGD
ncbi:hypothetical protein FH972_000890 [Carpinus fangiana]|uniref:Uncharacterized protein n=1 Tax=Carpinus fangiana TaxID=176857 RepID=A0A5N6QA23_9ROSI|nr:hypothetical protein FH972_000890 [Carpinus fangiana]